MPAPPWSHRWAGLSSSYRASFPPANGFSNQRPSNSFWDVWRATRAGTSSFVAARTVTSIGSPGRHLDAAVVHDHRVLRLGHNPATGVEEGLVRHDPPRPDRKSTRLNSIHSSISYAVFC